MERENNEGKVRISFAARTKPAPIAGFIISGENSAKSMTRLYFYRKPKLVKGKTWYIEYYYRIPISVRHLYKEKEWYRFRITEDMNRRKGQEREQYAAWLLEEITDILRRGYNPFRADIHLLSEKEREHKIELPKLLVVKDAMQHFLDKWKERGLVKESLSKYTRYVGKFMEWAKDNSLLFEDVKLIRTEHIEKFLADFQKKTNLSNRERNNAFDFIRTAFNYLLKKKYISENPCTGIDKLKSKSHKHRFYDTESLKTITGKLKVLDPYLYFACQVVYYLCVRADKELRYLKVGNINWEQSTVLVEADGSKGATARYIPMDDNMRALFVANGINRANPEYYIFSSGDRPGANPLSHGYFAKRFQKLRKSAKLPDDYTLYSFKHTRIVHLKIDGVSDADIMSLTGHKDFMSYTKYLRDLGLSADIKKINAKSRVI